MSERKLAAILFADIVGYTAMMQSDEGNAVSRLNHYQEVLKKSVNEHRGEIIKNYGDGSLCLFTSVLDAVHCAKVVQIELKNEPRVPLRIGLHLGDVMYRENDIYGNAINVASRIESMAIPGSVLMSKDIQKKINNQSDLLTQSLGTFEFKNVEEPMEVFALANEGFAIPKPDEMQGKGKATSKSSNKLWYALIPLLLLTGAFSIYQWQQTTSTPKISEEIRRERIAVLPFKNNTNDTDLDILGDMSADWINRGLMEMEDIEVTSPFTVRSNLGALGIAPDDPQGRPSFSELTGAQNMLSGNYYEQNGDIIFRLQIESAIDGKIRFIFDPIRGPKDDKEALLTQLGSQVAGYWVAREMVDSKSIQAPNYEAYVAYHDALQKFDSGAEFAKVFELDSSFYLARLHFLNANRHGLFGNNGKHFEFLGRHASGLSSYETAWYNYLKGYYSGDAQQAFESLNKLRMKYPKDFILNHETAVVAAGAFSNPELALEIYSELPIETVDAESVGVYYNWRMFVQVPSFMKLEQFSNLSNFLNTVKVSTGIVNSIYISVLLTNALAGNNTDEIDKAYAQFLKVYEYDKYSFFLASTIYLFSTTGTPIRNRIKSDFLSFYQKLDSTDLNKTLWKPEAALIDGKSQNMSLDEIRKLPKNIAMKSLYAEAMISLNSGNNNAESLIRELMEYTSIDYDTASQWGAGQAHYYLGKIFTKMSKPDDAIRHLKESRKLGTSVFLSAYKYDIHLASLVGIPEFDALTDPIWPEVKD